jgi:hypothetical protein
LEKNGFTVARIYPNTEEKWEPTDTFMEYAITREEWLRTRQDPGSSD